MRRVREGHLANGAPCQPRATCRACGARPPTRSLRATQIVSREASRGMARLPGTVGSEVPRGSRTGALCRRVEAARCSKLLCACLTTVQYFSSRARRRAPGEACGAWTAASMPRTVHTPALSQRKRAPVLYHGWEGEPLRLHALGGHLTLRRQLHRASSRWRRASQAVLLARLQCTRAVGAPGERVRIDEHLRTRSRVRRFQEHHCGAQVSATLRLLAPPERPLDLIGPLPHPGLTYTRSLG